MSISTRCLIIIIIITIYILTNFVSTLVSESVHIYPVFWWQTMVEKMKPDVNFVQSEYMTMTSLSHL